MSTEKIDHVSEGLGRALTFFNDKEDYKALLEIFLNSVQEVEDAFAELSTIKDLSTVTGIWLDYLGSILGEDRNGIADEQYRANLKLRIAINTSDGTAPVIQEIIRTYTDSDFVRIATGVLSYGQLILNGITNVNSPLYYLVEDIVAVTTKVLILQDTEQKSFFPSWETQLKALDAFYLEDGLGGQEIFELTLSPELPPSPYYATLNGDLLSLDQDTINAYQLEWEDPDITNSTLLPWEIDETTNKVDGYSEWLNDFLTIYPDFDYIENLFIDLEDIPPRFPNY